MASVDLLKQEIIFNTFDSPSEAWESRGMKKILAGGYADWLSPFEHWDSFITLTFRDEISPDWAGKQFQYLVKALNTELFGNHYSRIVGHSYFSYILGASNQKRGVVHYHLLADQPVNFNLIKSLWYQWAGIAQAEHIRNLTGAVNYATKAIIEGGDISVYKAKKAFIPKYSPPWWK